MSLSEQEINHLLATISFRIRQSLDTGEILNTAVREVRQLLQCDRVLIYHFQPDWSGKVTFEAVRDRKWSILGDVIRDPCFESSWTDRYLQGMVTVHENINDAEIDECHKELLQYFEVRANLVAPIISPSKQKSNYATRKPTIPLLACEIPESSLNNEVSETPRLWGLLIAHECQKSRMWQEVEINLFRQLAVQVAIAIQQAELLERTNRELQEKKLAEKQTHQVRKFLQTVIDRLPIAVYVKDASKTNFGKLQLWNRATEKIFNLEAPQVLGKTVYDYFPAEKAREFLQQDIEVIANQEALDIPEEQLQNSARESKIVHKVKVPLYDEQQQPQYLLCIAEDITARKQAELEIRRKSAELTAFSDNLKQLHRLNTTDYQNFTELFQDHLQTGCQMFQCSTGIVSRVRQDIYQIYAVESNIATLAPNMEFSLVDTYCAEVVREEKTITYNCVGKMAGLRSHPVYQNLKLESYIGTPILVDGSVYGTLNFSHTESRTTNFSDREKETIEMMAQSIGRFISTHQVEQKRREAEALLTQAKNQLELRVIQRTAELEIANRLLQRELQERKQTQLALQASKDNLKESERRWRSLLENVRLLVVGLDVGGNIDYVNPYFLELTGYSAEEVIKQNWFDRFVSSPERTESRQLHDTLLQTSGVSHQSYQNQIVTKSGETKTIAWNSTQLLDLQGLPLGMMCIGEDITERQAIELMKDEFISVVSHELRTPLTSIRGALGLLNSPALNGQPEKQAKVINIATESTEHLVKLVNDILELEKLESSKTELIIHPIEVTYLVSQAIERVQIVAQRSAIELHTKVEAGNFLGDSDRLLQVLSNLLSNAIKFSDSGSSVLLTAKFRSSEIIFTVSDRGRGIPQDKLESIFERFHQVDASDSRRKGGTGLGLAISRSIVEQHQGKIWVESVYGQGSKFYFSIPRELSQD